MQLPRAIVVTMPAQKAPPKPETTRPSGSIVGVIAIGTFMLTFVAFALATIGT